MYRILNVIILSIFGFTIIVSNPPAQSPPDPPQKGTIEWAGGYTVPFMTKPYVNDPGVPKARLDHRNPQHVDDSDKEKDGELSSTIDHINGDKKYDSYVGTNQECQDDDGIGGTIRSYYDPFGTTPANCRSYDAHSGHDYSMSVGTPVRSVADGVYERHGSEGRVIHDLSGDGQLEYVSIYRHLSSHVADDGAELRP